MFLDKKCASRIMEANIAIDGHSLAEKFADLAEFAHETGADDASIIIGYTEDGEKIEGEYVPEIVLRVKKK